MSFVFLKGIVRPEQITHKIWLISAWVSWSLAFLCTLLAFCFSLLAMRYAQRKFKKEVHREKNFEACLAPPCFSSIQVQESPLWQGWSPCLFFVTNNLNYDRPPSSQVSATNNATTGATNAAATTPITGAGAP